MNDRVLHPTVGLAAATAGEIGAVGDRDGSILVLPVGSTEQHGDHLPVATDSLLASAIAVDAAIPVAEDVPILVAPPIWTGYSPHHLPLGGTATGEFDTLLELLDEVAGSLLENGFDAILFCNGHGGNTALIDTAVSTVGRAHPTTEVLGLTYFELAGEAIAEIRESDPGGMAHGGEYETSLMCHLYPDLVREEAMPATYWEEHYELGSTDLLEGGPLSVYRGFDEYSESGAIGAPELASAETGARIHECVTDELSSLYRAVHEQNR